MKEVIFEITAFEQIKGVGMILISGQLLERREVLYGSLLFLEIRNKMDPLNGLAKHSFGKPLLY